MAEMSQPEWVASEQWLVFISGRPLTPGEVDQHGLRDWWADLRGRKLDDVKADFRRVLGQVEHLVSDLPHSIKGYGIEELEVGLAFTAEGQLAFIAKAGVEASVKVQFKRRPESPALTGKEESSQASSTASAIKDL